MKRNRKLEKTIQKAELDCVPQDLLLEIERAWFGGPPVLPVEWVNNSYLERHDVYSAFSDKRWDEVLCKDIPDYFCGLTCFQNAPTGSAGYYLASYIKCWFASSDTDRDRILDCIEFLLQHLMRNRDQTELDVSQCIAVGHFLHLLDVRLVLTSPPELVVEWKRMVNEMSNSKTGDL